MLYRFRFIVITLIQIRPVKITLLIVLRWVRLLIEDMAFRSAGPASTQSLDENALIGLDEGNNINASIKFLKHGFQRLGLRGSAGEAIQNSAFFTVWTRKTFPYHGNRHIIRDELSFGHICLS